MRALRYLALAALSLTTLAAKKASGSTFDKYFSKQSSSSPVILDDRAYAELASTPRDYTAAILLTALDSKYACGVCTEFDPEWSVLARSWHKADKAGDKRILFGTLDFDKGRAIFMQLQLQTAPILLLFPPTTGPNASADPAPARLDFLGPQSAEAVHQWIIRHLPPSEYPSIVRPVNYGRIVTTITLAVGVFTLGTVAWPYLVPIITNRNVWAGISIITVLLFTSGHMFNHIRKVPYVTGDGRNIQYFAPGFGNQHGMETQIIAAMYAILSFALIALGLKVPRTKDPRAQQISAIIWASVLFGMYSFLMSVFRVKNGGYPFWLPPF